MTQEIWEYRGNSNRLETPPRVVVILGASGGIGRALLDSYRGERVAIYASANERAEELAQVARERVAKNEFDAMTVLRADLSVPDEAPRLAARLVERLAADAQFPETPRLDELAIPVGIDLMTPQAKALDFDARLEAALNVDFFAVARLARSLGDVMRRYSEKTRPASLPSILLFSWDGVQFGRRGESSLIYGACKGAVAGFARSLAKELAPSVRVNSIAPGWIDTTWGKTAPLEIRERCAKDSVLARWGEASEVAKVARFLLSPDASYVNGQEIAVNGGRA